MARQRRAPAPAGTEAAAAAVAEEEEDSENRAAHERRNDRGSDDRLHADGYAGDDAETLLELEIEIPIEEEQGDDRPDADGKESPQGDEGLSRRAQMFGSAGALAELRTEFPQDYRWSLV